MSSHGGINRRSRRRQATIARKLRVSASKSLHSRSLATAVTVGAISLATGIISNTDLAYAGPDACTIAGTVVICTGDQSAGVASGTDFPAQPGVPNIDTLNVNTLNRAITPAGANAGVSFENTGSGNVNINVDSGRFGIQSTGDGIYGRVAGNGNVSITNIGDITSTNEEGIDAEIDGTGNITIDNKGNITDDDESIDATISGGGDITITSSGDLTSNSGRGIDAYVDGNGIILINSFGNIVSAEEGLYGHNHGNGSITIRHSGDIQSNLAGIVANSDDDGEVVINLRGNITSNQIGVFGRAYNDDTTITVTGNVNAQGPAGISGISNGGNVNIRSSGYVRSQTGHAIFGYSYDGNVDVTASGTIVSRNNGIYGYSYYGSTTIRSSANINSAEANGIYAVSDTGTSITIQNSGDIQANIDAIYAATRGTGPIIITNTGDITGNRTGLTVCRCAGNAPAIITNTGRITGNGGFAIDLSGNGNDVVNLNAGSVIQGSIDFGNGNDGMGGTNPNDIDTLNVGPGVNGVFTFADNSGAVGDGPLQSAPENINVAGGSVLLNGGTTLVTVDATGFAAQGTFVSDLTDVIFNSVDGDETGYSGNAIPASVLGFASHDTNEEHKGWGSVFGGRHRIAADDNNTVFEHDLAGLMTGLEMGDATTDGLLGMFGGFGYSDISIATNTGGTEIDTVFGGLYWKQDFGSHRIHAAFAAGVTDNENSRNVNGTLANGEFDGVFFSPSLTVSVPLDFFSSPAFLGFRASYSNLQLDGFTETGIAQPLTVGDRSVSVFNVRGQFDFPEIRLDQSGATTLINWSLGVDLTQSAGSDNVAATVTGVPFGFAADLKNEQLAFVSLNMAHTSENGNHVISLNGEFQTDFDGGTSATGELKATYRF